MKIVDEIIELLRKLRDPVAGCPWDIRQTHYSLAPLMVEEAWEVVDAIIENGNLEEELGDIFLNVLFHCQIASENKKFDFEGVCKKLKDKIIKKHPHVFARETRTDISEQDVLELWEQEKKTSIEVSRIFPSNLRARIASDKASRHGICFHDEEEIWNKIEEELQEVKNASSLDEFKSEVGDLLFCIAELCRMKGVDPEVALNFSVDKFLERLNWLLDGMRCEKNFPINSKEAWDKVKNDT